VCGDWAGPRPVAQAQATQACVTDAITRAVAKVNVPALTAFAESKMRKGARAVAVASR
jgi:hypothetical protein